MTAAKTGAAGERLAAEHYAADGYTLVASNYKCRMGELDLVLQRGEQIVIAEVKTRSGTAMGPPGLWVDARKQQKIILAARHFLQHEGFWERPVRIDVVEILLRPDGSHTHNRIENAFTA